MPADYCINALEYFSCDDTLIRLYSCAIILLHGYTILRLYDFTIILLSIVVF